MSQVMQRSVLRWFFRERTGFLFPSLIGARRLAIDLPILPLGVLAWYLFITNLPNSAQAAFRSLLESPWFDASFLGVLLYGLEISWMRDHLKPGSLTGRFFGPSRVLDEYKRQFGTDVAVKALTGIRLTVLGTFLVGTVLRARV